MKDHKVDVSWKNENTLQISVKPIGAGLPRMEGATIDDLLPVEEHNSNAKREPGYYWVKIGDKWIVALWLSGENKNGWTLFMLDAVSGEPQSGLLIDNHFDEINENRILSPGEGLSFYLDTSSMVGKTICENAKASVSFIPEKNCFEVSIKS